MFDEYFESQQIIEPEPQVIDPNDPAANASQDTNGPSVSISIGQDAPSTSHIQSTSNDQTSSEHQGNAVDNSFEGNPFAQPFDEPLINMFAPEPSHETTSSEDSNTATSIHYPQHHEHSENGQVITRLIISLETPLVLYPLVNNLQPIPCGASSTPYFPKLSPRTSKMH